MFYRTSCSWCGTDFRSLLWRRVQHFDARHEESCRASANLGWLADVRESMSDRDAFESRDPRVNTVLVADLRDQVQAMSQPSPAISDYDRNRATA